MGSATSCPDEIMQDSDDVSVIMNGCAKLEEMVKGDAMCQRMLQPVVEKSPPNGDDLEGWKARRKSVHELAVKYVKLVESNDNKVPSTIDELVAAQLCLSGDINLSGADRDDNEEAGLLFVFGLPTVSEIPQSVLSLGEKVEKLSLKKNKLSAIPPEISSLSSLKELDVSENELAALPKELFSIESLESLNISENNIESIPEEIGQLKGLSTLIAFKNKVTQLPETFGQCEGLEEVNFFNNKLIKVPASISDLENLVDLNLGGNKIKMFPSTKKYSKIERLALSWNNIVVLNDFGGMKSLRQLQINRNQLSELPDDAFEGCEDLEVVDMSSNRFEKLPSSFSDCSGVVTIDLTTNQLTELPDLSKLTKLKILKVGTNKISSLASANLGTCESLETLFVCSNAMESLPVELGGLPKLCRVNIKDNADIKDTENIFEKLQAQCKTLKGRWIN